MVWKVDVFGVRNQGNNRGNVHASSYCGAFV